MTLTWTKEEIKNELLHWTVYGIVEGSQDIETAFDQALNSLQDTLEEDGYSATKEEYYTEAFMLACFEEVEKIMHEDL
jgi:hypothetical protein